MKAPGTPIKSRHRLLAWARRWHAWGGLIAALFLLIVGSTGILLNYSEPVLSALGLEPRETARRSPLKAIDPETMPGPDFSTVTGVGAASVEAGDALILARQHLGDVPLDRIELKREADALVWKIKAMDEREIIVNAQSGASYLKGRYQKVVSEVASGEPVRGTDWGKIALDLHTGKIGGEAGKAIMTVMAAVLVFLSLSGVYLYAKPLLIQRANARARSGAASKLPVEGGTTSPTL